MLYFDESEYTGPDLTNSNQPYFSLASIRMTNEEIAQIKKDVGETTRPTYSKKIR